MEHIRGAVITYTCAENLLIELNLLDNNMREELLVFSFTQGNGDTEKSSNLPNITQLGFKLKCLEPSLLACLPSPCSSQLLGSCTCGQSGWSGWSPTAHLTPVLTPTQCPRTQRPLPLGYSSSMYWSRPSSNPTVPTKPFAIYYSWVY